MSRPRRKAAESPTILYNVIYEDGSRSSNRRVAREVAEGLDGGDAAVRATLEAQDREIAEKSGRPRGPIKRVERVPG